MFPPMKLLKWKKPQHITVLYLLARSHSSFQTSVPSNSHNSTPIPAPHYNHQISTYTSAAHHWAGAVHELLLERVFEWIFFSRQFMNIQNDKMENLRAADNWDSWSKRGRQPNVSNDNSAGVPTNINVTKREPPASDSSLISLRLKANICCCVVLFALANILLALVPIWNVTDGINRLQ